MRRADREIQNPEEIAAIMEKCDAVSIAFAGDVPYVLPMSFGFEWTGEQPALYLHGAGEGEKVSRMEKDSRAAFSMYTGTEIQTGAAACQYSTTYESVCGQGNLILLSGAEKQHGLEVLMRHYTKESLTFDEKTVHAVNVWKLEVSHISGKRRA